MAASDRWAAGGLAILYIGSRIAACMAGVRFDLSPMDTSWQILDPVLLHHDLLTSLFYMPGQPPLYNLGLGLVVKLSAALGGGELMTVALFRMLFSTLALGTTLLFYGLLRRCELPVWAAASLAGLFMCSPALILYESIPYYAVPVLALMTVIAWLFNDCLARLTPGRILGLFVAMTALIYTRSLFQLPWFVVLAAYCTLILPGHRRMVLLAATVPLLLILALYAKNLAVTGQFSTSDWLGMSWSKLTTLQLDHDQRAQLVANGDMSSVALQDQAFGQPEVYDDIAGPSPTTGIAVLDRERKSTGHVNYNYLPYARISAMARADAITAIRMHPDDYLRAVATAWLMSWRPASDYPFLEANRQAIQPWSQVYARLVAGQPVYPDKPGFALEPDTIGLLIVAGHALAILFGLAVLLRCLYRRQLTRLDATLIFIWLNMMYVSVVGNLFEIDENQRFRFAINPLILILDAVACQRAGRWLKHSLIRFHPPEHMPETHDPARRDAG